MTTVGQRLQQLIQNEGHTQGSFAEKFNFRQSLLSEVLNDKRALGIHTAKKFIEAIPDANLNWIYFEIGAMKLSDEVKGEAALREPSLEYNKDPMEAVFLKYLKSDSIKVIIEKLVEQKLKQMKLSLDK